MYSYSFNIFSAYIGWWSAVSGNILILPATLKFCDHIYTEA